MVSTPADTAATSETTQLINAQSSSHLLIASHKTSVSNIYSPGETRTKVSPLIQRDVQALQRLTQ